MGSPPEGPIATIHQRLTKASAPKIMRAFLEVEQDELVRKGGGRIEGFQNVVRKLLARNINGRDLRTLHMRSCNLAIPELEPIVAAAVLHEFGQFQRKKIRPLPFATYRPAALQALLIIIGNNGIGANRIEKPMEGIELATMEEYCALVSSRKEHQETRITNSIQLADQALRRKGGEEDEKAAEILTGTAEAVQRKGLMKLWQAHQASPAILGYLCEQLEGTDQARSVHLFCTGIHNQLHPTGPLRNGAGAQNNKRKAEELLVACPPLRRIYNSGVWQTDES